MERSIENNVAKIRDEIARVCASCGRSAEKVTLVAVSKKQGLEKIYDAQDAGISIFGENRMQELLSKKNESGDRIRWHYIGHLQTNKIKQLLPISELIHSVDSTHLAEAIAGQALNLNKPAEVLLQVNTSAEESKFGFSPETVMEACYAISNLNGIEVKGLMTMAPYTDDIKVISGCFSLLRQLYDQIAKQTMRNVGMTYLSMGMSNDFQIALKEGSNMLRIGSSIFGSRN